MAAQRRLGKELVRRQSDLGSATVRAQAGTERALARWSRDMGRLWARHAVSHWIR